MAATKSLFAFALLLVLGTTQGFSFISKNGENIETGLLARLERLETEMSGMKAELEKGKLQIRQQEMEIFELKKALQLTSNGERRPVVRKSERAEGRAVLPISCRELSLYGHTLDGFYLVASPNSPNKIEAVFCDFGATNPDETVFGNVDIKTASVHFFVQRTAPFSTPNSVVTYTQTVLNIGNAMNQNTGSFVAPKAGTYHFEFSGQRDDNSTETLSIRLRRNNAVVNEAQCVTPSSTCSLQATLDLLANDRIDLFNFGNGTLFDTANHLTHFTGSLLEENLVL